MYLVKIYPPTERKVTSTGPEVDANLKWREISAVPVTNSTRDNTNPPENAENLDMSFHRSSQLSEVINLL